MRLHILWLPAFLLSTTLHAQTPQAAGTTEPSSPVPAAPETLPEVIVNAQTPETYRAPAAVSVSKTDVPLITQPISIQTVPGQVIEDQRATTVAEAVKNVSGVRTNNNDLEGYIFNLRGFTTNFLYRNALAVPYSTATIQETANLERVEVIKGPASVLFGRIEPGGAINMVTKKPLGEAAYSLQQEVGSFDFYRTTWDFTGPIAVGDTLSYRLTGAYQNSGSFRDFIEIERTFVSPVVTWKINEDTELTVEFEYMRNDAESDMGFPTVGTRPANVPYSRSFQEPNDPTDYSESRKLAAEFSHRFHENWKLTSRFLLSDADTWKLNIGPIGLGGDNRTIERAFQHQYLYGRSYAFNLDVTGQFETLGIKHDLLLGYDLLHDYYNYRYADLSGNLPPAVLAAMPMDLYRPIYGRIPTAAYSHVVSRPDFDFYSSAKVEQNGFYLQDHLAIAEDWHVLLAGRYDHSRQPYGSSDVSAEEARDSVVTESDHHFTPQAGLLYHPLHWLSAYGSYAESFGVNNGRDAQGRALPAEEGAQYEAGLKFDLLEDRLSATLAAYELTKKNVLTGDPSTADPTDAKAVGEIRSRGLELDVVGQLTERISLIGSYAYTDAEVTKDFDGLEGNRVATVPLNSGSLSLVYDFRDPDNGEGWRAGLSLFATQGRPGDIENTFILPGYSRFDAFASYSRLIGSSRWTAQLNVFNLGDRNYIEGVDSFYNTFGRMGLYPGAERSFNFSIKAEF
jgi:iron complex outermembrane receptor protein